jgi:hypothetical protein
VKALATSALVAAKGLIVALGYIVDRVVCVPIEKQVRHRWRPAAG